MPLTRITNKLTVKTSESVALVLDASESALDHWPEIATTATNLIDILPSGVIQGLWFLGNPKKYPAADFHTKNSEWFAENKNRISLIAPVMETLTAPDQTKIVVLGNGPIFDLADWWLSYAENFILINFGTPLAERLARRELSAVAASDLTQQVSDAVTRIEIYSGALAPIRWDNPAYEVGYDGTQFSLRAERAASFEVTITWLGPTTQSIEAIVTRASGKKQTLRLDPVENFSQPAPEEWIPLTKAEVDLFNNVIQHQSFFCPVCGTKHNWDVIRCLDSPSILGQIIYPTVQNLKPSAFVIFKKDGENVSVRAYPNTVLELSPDTIAVYTPQTLRILKFNEQTQNWIDTNTAFPQYAQLDRGIYAIVVR